jgi:c-di-GMP-binding flagellar brake protein YcgR
MSSSMLWGGPSEEAQTIAGDRRGDRRYEIRLDTRWRLVRRRRVLETGSGRTLDFSSGGVLFEPGRQLPIGLNVELSISWPVLLHDVAPLQLLVCGRVVRSDGRRTAIRMVQHEFRTVGVPAEPRRPAARPSASSAAFANLGAMTGLEKVQ